MHGGISVSRRLARACQSTQTLAHPENPNLLCKTIHWHHYILPPRDSNQNVIEACRKADWTHVAMGKLRKGMAKTAIAEVEDAFLLVT